MKKIKITALRKVHYADLSEIYEGPVENDCDITEGQVFYSEGNEKPEGMCEGAWMAIEPFAASLSNGGGNFYNGWMKNPYSAMISCTDGFRPVTFLIETIEE